ncbi:MAG: hypothetical protein QOH53_975, partial [Ilumatobacteraceae bacterium]
VERGGRWYVSLEYTIAEYVRQATGWELGGAVSRAPVGFDSPDAAVTGFYDRLASLDLQGAMDTFAPGEDAMAWLAQAWLDGAQSAIERGQLNGWTVGVSGLTYETTGTGDHLTLRPLTFKIEGTVPVRFGADTPGIADPSLPTVVSAFDGSGYALVPPGQVPATIEGLHFTSIFPAEKGDVEGGHFNFTSADTGGNITPLTFPTEPTTSPEPFTIERADGCTTVTGRGATAFFGLDSGLAPALKAVDGGFQYCGGADQSLGFFGLFLAGGLFELPPISVVQSAGRWYVSPLGTILASVSTGLHALSDDATLLDSPLAPFFYGGLSRGVLESMVGHSVDSVPPECLAALTVDNGQVSGVAANPSPDAVKGCTGLSFSSSSGSGSGQGVVVGSIPVPEQAPQTPTADEGAPPATAP